MAHRAGWKEFLRLFSKIEGEKQLETFFEFFLTHEEIEILAARFCIVRALLEEKLTQRDISKQYGVSIAQITRGSNALKSMSPKLKVLLKQDGLSS